MHTTALLPLLLLAPLAQDAPPEAPPETPPEPWEIALEALQGLRAEPIAFRGSVAKDRPDRDGGPFGGAIFVDGGLGGAQGEFFEGEFEGFRYSDDEFCVASKQRFGGFEAWQGEALIVQTLGGRELIDVAGATDRLTMLLDANHLARVADEAEWEAKELPDAKGWTVTTTLAPEAIEKPAPEPDPNDPFGGMIAVRAFGPGGNDEPLRVETTLTVDAAGRLTRATYAIVHNDSQAVMQKMFEEAREGEDGAIALDFGMEQDYEPIDGEVVTWTLEFGGAEPTKRVAAFRALALDVLETEDVTKD